MSARITAICVGAAVLAFAAAPASASAAHIYSYSFSGAGSNELLRPTDVAVDNSSGPSAHHLYVTDPGHYRIVKFDSAGNFILMFGDGVDQTTGGDVCSAASGDICGAGIAGSSWPSSGQPLNRFSSPGQIAVDVSGGPSSGDLYVADISRVTKFDSSGHPIESWGEGGRLSYSDIAGIAVGPDGRLFVMENTGPARMWAYDENGAYLSDVQLATTSGRIAIDSSYGLYRVNQAGGVIAFNAAGSDISSIDAGNDTRGMAIDPSVDHLYVNHGAGFIDHYDPSECVWQFCNPEATFGLGFLTSLNKWFPRGISVDATSHTVYAINPDPWQGGEVAVFLPPGMIPEVSTEPASDLGEATATINADIDPAGSGVVTGCHFEVVGDASVSPGDYAGAEQPRCKPAPPYAAPTDVSAHLTGLDRGTAYRYRVMVTNARGRSTGLDRIFRTLEFPGVVTDGVVGIGEWAVKLVGTVEPRNAGPVTDCRFEYVDHTGFRSNGYRYADSAPCAPGPPHWAATTVSTVLSELEDDTLYHYRLVASNSQGTAIGGDRTFEIPRPPQTRPRHRRVRCAKKACVHVLEGSSRRKTWVSPRFPLEYGWLFSVYRKRRPLRLTRVADDCRGTFRGQGIVARVDGCHGRFRLTYRGPGRFTVRWRVFEHCTCARQTERPGQVAGHAQKFLAFGPTGRENR